MQESKWQIDQDYSIKVMSKEEFTPLFQKFTQIIFKEDTQVFRLWDALSKDEATRLEQLEKNMGTPFMLRLGIFYRNEFVGWHFGRQDSYTSFYMQNSAILPEHRNKRLYTKLMARVLTITSELGFQKIWSRHNATNNAVIIPKLKAGFVISALEISDTFGTLVHLNYFPNATRKKMMDYRVGQIKPDQEIKKLLGI